MKIGIDARFWGQAGPGRYVKNLILSLEKIDSENTYIIFNLQGSKDYKVSSERFKSVSVDVPWFSFAEQIKLPFIFGKQQLDLLHVPFFNIPIFYPGKIAVTIHDLTIHRFSTARATTRWRPFNLLKRLIYRFVFWFALKRAVVIFTPTEFVKQDLLREYGWLDQSKITVTHEGVGKDLRGAESGKRYAECGMRNAERTNRDYKILSAKYGIRKPYLLYVGSMYPHKNLERLVEAFWLVSEEYPDLSLILVGKLDYFQKRLRDAVDQGSARGKTSGVFSDPTPEVGESGGVIFPAFAAKDRYVPDEDLAVFYKNALAFVFPSLSEGFGLPPLEAMQFGTPVCASNATAIPEICADAALYFDPQDTKDMAAKMKAIVKNGELRKDLVRKGYNNLDRFSWNKMARETLEGYRKTVCQ